MAGVRTREQYLEIPALPEAVSQARRHVRRVLKEWRMEQLLDTAELIVSELATNAVNATLKSASRITAGETRSDTAGHIWVDVQRIPALVVLEVWDGSRVPPVLKEAECGDEGGRGLHLVNALAANWGYRLQVSGGKVVWCTLPSGDIA